MSWDDTFQSSMEKLIQLQFTLVNAALVLFVKSAGQAEFIFLYLLLLAVIDTLAASGSLKIEYLVTFAII